MSELDAGAGAPTNEFVAAQPDNDAAPATEVTSDVAPSMEDTLLEVWNKHHQDESSAARDAGGAGSDRHKISPDQTAEAAREQAETTATAIAPPSSWTGEMKAKWASLPPEFRDLAEYAAKRDREQHDAISRAGQQIKAYEPIGKVIEQFAETFQRNNLPPAEAIGRMLTMERWLERDAKSAIAELARVYAVDLREPAGQPTGAPANGQDGTATVADPRVSTLETVLAETQRELRQVRSHLTAQQRAEHDAREAALARQIADFAKDKPHFAAVRRHMGALMAMDETLSISDAYEQATYAVPDIRNRILQDQRKADEDRRAQEARKKASAARTAAQVNVRSAGAAGASPKTMDDTLQEIARRAYA